MGRFRIALSLALFLLACAIGAALVCLCGCAKTREQGADNPAPSASATKQQAVAVASLWATLAPNRSYCEVSTTASMLPVFDSASVLLLEKATAADLKVNDIATYTVATDGTGDATITHRVKDVQPDGVLFEGDNNVPSVLNPGSSDGYIAPKRIRWRVAGILFSQRSP